MRLQPWKEYTDARTLGPWKIDGFQAGFDAKDEYWPKTRAIAERTKLLADFPATSKDALTSVTFEQDEDMISGDDSKAWIFTLTFKDGMIVAYTLSKILAERANPQGWNANDDPDYYFIGVDSAGNPGAGHWVRMKSPDPVSAMIIAYKPDPQPHEVLPTPGLTPPYPAPAGKQWWKSAMGEWMLADIPGTSVVSPDAIPGLLVKFERILRGQA